MKKVKNFLNGMMDYVGNSYLDSLIFNNWDQLVLSFGLLAALIVFFKSEANVLLTIATPIVGLLVFQVIKLLIYVVKFFYNVLEDLRHEEITFLYFYKD